MSSITTDATIIHIKISHLNVTEIIEIPPRSTLEEIRGVFYAAAELPYNEDGVGNAILKLFDSSGAMMPIGHGIDGNSAKDFYTLTVVGDHSLNLGIMQSALEQVSSSSASLNDVEDLKNGIVALKKKLEEMDKNPSASATKYIPPANLTIASPIQKQAKKHIIINSHYKYKPKYILTEETKEYLRSPTFDNWAWDENELFGLFEFMFEDMNLLKEFSIDVETLRKFLISIRDCYNNNMFGILNVTEVVHKLKPIDKLILILSTIGHDLDHPGFNNAFQINAATDLAIIYNDISPLENHHAAVLFTILGNSETNVLANVSDAVYREARKNIIRCILATDMAKHGEIMAAFKKASETFNYEDTEHKSLLLQMIIKCSDISNEVRPTEISEPWVEALLNEFFTQSDTEKAQGLPTAPFMDRDKVTKAGAQVGFIGYVMIPLFELASKVLPNMEKTIIQPIKDSLTYYKVMLEKTPK